MIAPALVPSFILRVQLSGTCRESFQQMDPNRPSDFRAGHSANEGSRARGSGKVTAHGHMTKYSQSF